MDNIGAAIFIIGGMTAGVLYKGHGTPIFIAEELLSQRIAKPLETVCIRNNWNKMAVVTKSIPQFGGVAVGMTTGLCAGSMLWDYGAVPVKDRVVKIFNR